jgi:hypothetical protein
MRIRDIKLHLADAPRLAADELADLLTAHRCGDASASEKLREGLAYLVWEALLRSPDLEDEPGHKDPERLSELYNLLARAVAKLADSDLATENAVGFVVGYLTKGRDRKKRGLLKRIYDHPKPPRNAPTTDVLEDPGAPLPTANTYGQPYRRPSRFDQLSPDNEIVANEESAIESAKRYAEAEQLASVAETSQERAVVQIYRDGRPSDESCKALVGISHKNVAAILARLRERLRLCNRAA